MKLSAFLVCSILLPAFSFAQIADTSQLYSILKRNDSLLFNVGFNNCDIIQFENLIDDNFEFYHDQAGITTSKSKFISDVRDNLCTLPYKPRRELVAKSLQVFPLMNNNVLYGAIQKGQHKFYAIEKDSSERLTSVAEFTHVWLLKNGKWMLSRALSYDHTEPLDKK